MPLGVIFGFAITPFFVKDSYPIESRIKDTINFFYLGGIYLTAMRAFTLIFFREKPKYYPSLAARSMTKTEYGLKRDLKKLVSNKNFWFLSITVATQFSCYNCFSSVVNSVLFAYEYSTLDTSIVAASFVFAGVIGSFLFSYILDKYQIYIKTLRFICFGALLSCLCIAYTLPMKSTAILSANLFMLGLFNLPVIPIGFSFCVELTYPLGEALSNGLMMLLAYICGTTLSLIGSIICEGDNEINVVYMLSGVISLGCISSLFIKEDLRRINA